MRRTVVGITVFAAALASGYSQKHSPMPFVRFVDVTDASGIDFDHDRGASGRRYLAEIVGAGVLAFDYDADGTSDLYFVNGAPLPGTTGESAGNRLYRNVGNGRFRDVTDVAGVRGGDYGTGGAAADIDNDGDIDLLVTAFGRNRFFRNNGDGTFAEHTASAGVGDERWATSAAFFDADADGFVDVYVANYLDYTLARHRECVSPVRDIISYCHPQEYDGVSDLFYRNRGDGTFENATASSGVGASEGGKGLGVVVTDFDNDGDPDLYVANDTTRNFLFENLGNGSFRERGLQSGVAYNEEGLPEAGMGTDWGDVDRDGLFDVVVTNFDFETNTLYQNLGDGFFFDATAALGLGDQSLTELGFGCDLADFDNDGWLDLVVTNGHILDNITSIQSNLTYAQPAQFFRNIGGRFRNETDAAGSALRRARVGRGLATLDFDHDGAIDLVLTNNGGPAELLRNDTEADSAWVKLQLVGTISNRNAVGARVSTVGTELSWMEEVRAGSGYLSQNDLVIHVGLGSASARTSFIVRWPSGAMETLQKLSSGALYVVKEGRGVVALRELQP